MHKNKTLKTLLAVSAFAAMFGTVGAQAQTAVGSSPSQTGTSSTNPNMAGKTTKDGTIDNSNSTGMENRVKQVGDKGAMGASGAAGQTAASGAKLVAGDQQILKDIAGADLAEIEGGKLAQSKGTSAEVKAFGQQMIDDHTANLNEVKALADARGVTLPTEPDAKHKAMAAKLEKMSGDAFDKAYMTQAGVQDHKTVHAKLMAASKKAKDPEVKALVDKTEPVVAQHLKSAQQAATAKAGTSSGK
jgi:predicted outer membrane protein